MSFSRVHNIGAYISQEKAIDNTALTAGGAGDNTEVSGQIIDRLAYGDPQSVAILVAWKATLAASKKLSLKSVKLEHGDASNLSDAANFATPADVDVKVDGGSGGTYHGCQKYSVNLAGSKRYVRLKITPDLDASATDTATIAAAFVFGGLGELS